MNIIQKWILGKAVAELEKKFLGQRFQIRNGQLVMPSDNKQTYIDKGYCLNDIVYSIVNIILDKVRLPDWQLFKVVDEKKLREYQVTIKRNDISAKDYKKALRLKDESLQPYESFNLRLGKLNDLLTYANSAETFNDYIASSCGFKLLTGDIFDYGQVLGGGANEGIPEALWQLPPQYVKIISTSSFPAEEESYELLAWENLRFTKKEVLHEKYFNPNWGVQGMQLYGLSPLKAALRNITRNNSAKDASTAKFQNGGLEEIIYMDDQRYDAEQGLEQAQALKLKLAQEYSGPANQGKRAISGVKVGVAPLGLSPVELNIIESEKWDAIMLCNIFGVPPELLGLTQKTYNNVKEAEKALTSRSAIPLLTSRRNSLNRKLQTDWGFAGVNVYVDYSTECFAELEADTASIVGWTEKMIMITPDEQRELAGLDSLNTEESQEVWVMSGGNRVPLSEFQMNAVDEQLMRNAIIQGDKPDGDDEVPKNGEGKTGMPNGNGKAVSPKKKLPETN